MKSPDFYIGSYFNADDDNQHSHNSLDFHQNNNNHFTVDDLLDFSKGDAIIAAFFFYDHSSLPSVHISNSSSSGNESQPINSCSSFTDAPFSGNEVFVPGRSSGCYTTPYDRSSRILLINNSSSSKASNGTDPKTLPRKYVHCGSVKTLQWRSGPTGPKTLCNACGVRHKLGRLVPEYIPAASPAFVPRSTKTRTARLWSSGGKRKYS
ncbi:hypothetical protein LguiB_023239 [Lonicera macranthoides]